METLKAMGDSLDLVLLDLQVDFNRMLTRAEREQTVEEWARIAALGISFERVKRHKQQLMETIAGLERTIEAAIARQNGN